MSETKKIIAGPGFTGTVFADGEYAFELATASRPLLRLGRTRCGNFKEDGALIKRLRSHDSLDALSASIESESIIPFGCEYRVGRELQMVAGIASWTVDIGAVNRGIVSSVELEPVVFPGTWERLEYLVFGESEFRKVELDSKELEIYRGRELVVSVRLISADKNSVEFNAGGDLWRHRAAMHLPEVEGEYALMVSAAGVVLTRKIFAFPPESTIEKRPWRFKNSFAWSLSGDDFAVPATESVLDFATTKLPESGKRIKLDQKAASCPCLTAATSRRIFRDFVRHGASNLCVKGLTTGICVAAAHLERPGKKELEHFDFDDYLAFYLWGNRQLAKKGFSLRIDSAAEGLFAGSVGVANIRKYPLTPVGQKENIDE
ncbi:MAG: hypothetical protein LBM70_06355 [Victivallales bacterium]|nr:hypothetical protein [Victivallales bacterium]